MRGKNLIIVVVLLLVAAVAALVFFLLNKKPAETPPPEDNTAAGYEVFSQFAGQYSGTWRSSDGYDGGVSITVVVGKDGTASFKVNLSGKLFGKATMPPATSKGTYTETKASLSGKNPTYGSFTTTITSGGKLTLRAPDLSDYYSKTFLATGKIAGGKISGSFSQTYTDGSRDTGTFSTTLK